MAKLSASQEQFLIEMLPYVKFLATQVLKGLPPSVDLDDLFHYGVIGLLDAIKKFNPRRNIKFRTYAEIRIRGAILDGMRAADWVPRSARRKKRELEVAIREVEQELGRPASDREVAAHLNISLVEYQERQTSLHGTSLVSFEEVTELDTAENFHRMIPDHFPGIQGQDPLTEVMEDERRKLLASAIRQLPERMQVVMALYYYDGLTMKEVGQAMEISESRVSQLHSAACGLILKAVKGMSGFDAMRDATPEPEPQTEEREEVVSVVEPKPPIEVKTAIEKEASVIETAMSVMGGLLSRLATSDGFSGQNIETKLIVKFGRRKFRFRIRVEEVVKKVPKSTA